ncbi:MAG: TIGR02099 family protein [Gammaproteobacteria bacterium]|nr:TIGR02099 family protein [Gammaproteobacteria bacterium]MBU1625377.1 TIGR02099 family protein [Gammaproteobacteria bacterium]MBU1981637.1 TIGR02099 family protein [Gammaproteobacteria bacterium]
MLKLALRFTAIGTWRLSRVLLLLLLLLGAGGLLTLRYWVLPGIERYHAVIELAATSAVGRQVTIAHIEADWHGFRPRLLLSDVRVLDEQGATALQFPLLRNAVAWTTFFFGELRFHSLELERPQLLVRRDAQGNRFVAGISSNGQSELSSDAKSLDWLLRQSLIVVRNGRIIWQDELRNAPPIAFEKVDLIIQNVRGRHRLALNATPPAALATPIDLRANLRGDSFADTASWEGEVYTRMDHTDVGAWRTWFDLPSAINSGSGGVRFWLGLSAGVPVKLDADIDLSAVKTRLAEDLPELSLQRMQGRLGWQQSENGFEVSSSKLSLRTHDGFTLQPTDFLINLSAKSGYRSASGEVKVNALHLPDINRLLAYLPVAEDIKRKLTEFAPQGKIRNLHLSWQGDLEKLQRYQVRAQFDKVGLNQVGDWPSISGLSGTVEGNDSDGILKIDSRKLRLQAPGFLSEPLSFDRIYGQLDWQRNNQHGWDLKLNKVLVSNADAEGTVYGSYQINDGPGIADLTVSLTRVEVKHAARYIPMHAFNDQTYRWLQTGLQGGIADTFQMHVRGDLNDFPFPDSKIGLFRLTANAKDVAIEFDPGWPRIEKAKADLLIQGRLLEVKASKAETVGAALQNVRVALPDTLSKSLVMEVDGEAAGPTEHSLDYIRNSPVRGYLSGYTDDFHAKGRGLLKLRLDIPLTGGGDTSVKGSYRVDGNDIDLGGGVPLLSKAKGTLTFTEQSIKAEGVTAQILGGPARISLRNEGSVLFVHAAGTMDADSLYDTYGYPLLWRLHGKTAWQAEISVKDKLADVSVSSNLQGLSSNLPQPFNKTAAQSRSLKFELKDINAGKNQLKFRYGDIFKIDLARTRNEAGHWDIKRGNISLGKVADAPPQDGIWITGKLPYFSMQGWSGWASLPDSEGALPNIAGIDVNIDTVQGYGNALHDLQIRGSGRNGLISTRLDAREVSGDLIWQPQHEGKLYVRLKHLMLGETADVEVAKLAQDAPPTKAEAISMPEIDMVVDQLTWKGRQLGKLEMLMDDDAGDAVLKRMRLTNPDGVVNVGGRWRPLQGTSEISARIEIADAGRILARSGYPESLTGGGGLLVSELSWRGAPDELDFPSLNGSLQLTTGKGRFLQVDPGAAKLLGVLSLQSIPKRISLDFTDVFTPGFEFSSIKGEAVIQNGLLKTENFVMTGSSAKVTLQGDVDLARETQELKVRVLPAIGDNVSLLSFAAGPAIGMGVLLTNKLLRDPLDKLVSFDYNVSGSWADPKVERMGASRSQDTIDNNN